MPKLSRLGNLGYFCHFRPTCRTVAGLTHQLETAEVADCAVHARNPPGLIRMTSGSEGIRLKAPGPTAFDRGDRKIPQIRHD